MSFTRRVRGSIMRILAQATAPGGSVNTVKLVSLDVASVARAYAVDSAGVSYLLESPTNSIWANGAGTQAYGVGTAIDLDTAVHSNGITVDASGRFTLPSLGVYLGLFSVSITGANSDLSYQWVTDPGGTPTAVHAIGQALSVDSVITRSQAPYAAAIFTPGGSSLEVECQMLAGASGTPVIQKALSFASIRQVV